MLPTTTPLGSPFQGTSIPYEILPLLILGYTSHPPFRTGSGIHLLARMTQHTPSKSDPFVLPWKSHDHVIRVSWGRSNVGVTIDDY